MREASLHGKVLRLSAVLSAEADRVALYPIHHEYSLNSLGSRRYYAPTLLCPSVTHATWYYPSHTHMHAHTCTPTHLCTFATRLFGKRIPSFKVYLKKNFKKFTLYIWVFCLHVCVVTAYMPSTLKRQKMCQIS